MLLRCYPRITDWIYLFFNQAPSADYRFLPVYSYGFFVALAFFAAAIIVVNEMRRREGLGLLKGREVEVTIGKEPGFYDIALYFVFGFVIFFKLFGLIVYQPELSHYAILLPDYLLSFNYGSWLGGFAGGAVVAWYNYYTKNKQKLPKPEKTKKSIFPSDDIGDMVLIAAVLGVLGSNLFNFLEDPGDYETFWADPIGSLFSGLSIYGGLIFAGAGLGVYAYFRKINLWHFFDSVAPGFILANGIGRIGCHVSGDGDWGVANMHTKPAWFPQFLWSNNYEHNIINMDPGNVIPGCMEEHCNYLVHAVYPTPLYELIMCIAIFFILWGLRKSFTYKPGFIFVLCLALIGVQRFAIEQWRDLSGRDTYGFFGAQLRQSEIISIIMLVVGITGMIIIYRLAQKRANT